MNVVGRVGSLITQGVYSVATPFHPFGGAVDVIVVQQQDGTFRSTPWYVRFGKFQGVLKGAEKIVKITVNGVEANFHMYLDNSGEAYFVKEVHDGKEDWNNSGLSLEDNGIEIANKNNGKLNIVDIHGHRLDHSVSDSGVARFKDNCESSDLPRMQRVESDVDRRYYEFEDDQSSFEGAIELSENGSSPYENLDGENSADSQSPHPEMVLVSGDGHILMAPISESEQSTDDVELGTPQFHLGPGEGAFCEDNEFCSGENAWAANYISNLDASTSDVVPSRHCSTSVGNDVSGIQHEVCQGEGEHTRDETLKTENQEDRHMPNVSDEVAVGMKKEAVFQSCLELQELAQKVENASLEFQNSAEEFDASCAVVDENEESTVQSTIDELSPSCGSSPSNNKISNSELEIHEVEKNASGLFDTNSGFHSVTKDAESNGENASKSASIEGVNDSQQNPTIEDDCNKVELLEPQPESTNEGDKCDSGVEISLCGHEIKEGTGLAAAAEASESEAHQKAAEDDALKSRKCDSGSAWSERRWRLWPIPFRKVKTVEHASSSLSNDDVFLDSESVLQNSVLEPTPTSSSHGSPHKQLLKTNVPTNEQIASLNLKEGQNFVVFNFSTRVLGTQQVDAHIYLWKWNARIVISDVDGTITKSDVLGQFMPLVGKDWAQSGVAGLYSAIKENGYQLLFLSARAIVQAYLTRKFLLNLKQDGKALPKGPVVISPDGLFPSLFREVIRRAPHEFKIACLEDIKKLFPSDYNPFYAGFGNRDTDELSYLKIGIPKGKIFIINPKGEVAISSHRVDVKSYTSLHTLVNDMFPPTSLVEQEDFNSWNFWKMPLPDID